MGFRCSEGEFGIKLLAPVACENYYRLGILYIPKGTQVFESDKGGNNFPHKCRAEKAKVIGIASVYPDKNHGLDHNCCFISGLSYAESLHSDGYGSRRLVYIHGGFVEPEKSFSKKSVECASGIHYYKTPEDLVGSYLSDIVMYGMIGLNEHLIDQHERRIEETILDWFLGVTTWFTAILENEEG